MIYTVRVLEEHSIDPNTSLGRDSSGRSAREAPCPLTNDGEETAGDGGTSNKGEDDDPEEGPAFFVPHGDNVQRLGRHCGWWCRDSLDRCGVEVTRELSHLLPIEKDSL